MGENELDLKELKKLLIAYKEDYIDVHKVLREFLSWRIREIKKMEEGRDGRERYRIGVDNVSLL